MAGFDAVCPYDRFDDSALFLGVFSFFQTHGNYLQLISKQRFLLKKGITWFWNRSATALVWVPE